MDAEDDEFGDLYTDVLRPSSSSSAPIPSLLPSSKPSLDLNASEDDDDEDDLILYGKNPSFNDAPRDQPKPSSPTQPDELEEPSRVSAAPALDPVQEDQIRAQDDVKDRILTEERIGIEVGIGDLDSDQPMIPGLSTGAFAPAVFDASAANGGGVKAKDGGDEEDDWDSDDSEDDLQIVLNETLPIGAEQEDEDGEDLVIVADGDQHIPGIEEQEWGEEATQAAADGDRKEGGEAAKAGGGGGIAMVGPGGARIGYSNHGYHPHHSQFKVRFLMKTLEILVFVCFSELGMGSCNFEEMCCVVEVFCDCFFIVQCKCSLHRSKVILPPPMHVVVLEFPSCVAYAWCMCLELLLCFWMDFDNWAHFTWSFSYVTWFCFCFQSWICCEMNLLRRMEGLILARMFAWY